MNQYTAAAQSVLDDYRGQLARATSDERKSHVRARVKVCERILFDIGESAPTDKAGVLAIVAAVRGEIESEPRWLFPELPDRRTVEAAIEAAIIVKATIENLD